MENILNDNQAASDKVQNAHFYVKRTQFSSWFAKQTGKTRICGLQTDKKIIINSGQLSFFQFKFNIWRFLALQIQHTKLTITGNRGADFLPTFAEF